MGIKYNTTVVHDTVLVYDGFVCDRCGAEFDCDDIIETQESITINISGGYGSPFGDGYSGQVILCTKCSFDLLSPYVKSV